ncbi:SHK1 protein [Pelomyxa schiedti]|nr:SHK1 protein [Pelomyxa schiedti]
MSSSHSGHTSNIPPPSTPPPPIVPSARTVYATSTAAVTGHNSAAVTTTTNTTTGGSDRGNPPPTSTPSQTGGFQLRGRDPEVPRSLIKYSEADCLGSGRFGTVFSGTVLGTKVAVKVQNKCEDVSLFKQEIAMLKEIVHQNVVLFYGACTTEPKVIIVLERMLCNLYDFLFRKSSVPRELHKYYEGGLTLEKKLRLATDAARGIAWMHLVKNMVHRDLKPENFLMDDTMTLKVADLSFGDFFTADQPNIADKRVLGNVKYMAPEVYTKAKTASAASDVHAFGLILWEICSEQPAYQEYDQFPTYLEKVQHFEMDIIRGGHRPAIPEIIPSTKTPTPSALASLMQHCWNPAAAERPKMDFVLSELEKLRVESQITSATARVFWHNKFVHSQFQEDPISVSWSAFSRSLPRVGFSSQCRRILSQNESVTMSRFNLLQQWFGDFYLPESSYILRDIVILSSQQWFHPNINGDEAVTRLRDHPAGTFLVRFSMNDPVKTPFTISFQGPSPSNPMQLTPLNRRVSRSTYSAVPTALSYTCFTHSPGSPPPVVTAMNLTELVAKLVSMRELLTPLSDPSFEPKVIEYPDDE